MTVLSEKTGNLLSLDGHRPVFFGRSIRHSGVFFDLTHIDVGTVSLFGLTVFFNFIDNFLIRIIIGQ